MVEEKRTSILDTAMNEQTKKFNFLKKKEEPKTDKVNSELLSLIKVLERRLTSLEEKQDILKKIEEDSCRITIILPEQTIFLPKSQEKELIETLLYLKINCVIKNEVLDTMQIQEKTDLDTRK